MQDVINSSNDEKVVDCCIEALLDTMNQIESYSEKELNTAGLTKINAKQQKLFLLDNREIILEQVKDRK